MASPRGVSLASFALAVLFIVACSTQSGAARVDRDRVTYIPGYGKPQTTTYAGFIEVNKQYGAYLYYYFVSSQSNPSTDPVVLWLQGGPGCSSLFGAFVENGPQLITENGTLQTNPWSWNAKANVLWIDQPVGTGYSYVEDEEGYATSEKVISQELYTALVGFFNLHKDFSKQPFYVFGESYAGKYIPSLTHYIWQQNQKNPPLTINLKGLGMGDGWVDPYYQTGSFAPYLYSMGLINEAEVVTAEAAYETYKGLIDAGFFTVADVVGNTLLETLVLAAGDVDVYDVRYTGGDPTDPLMDALGTYLNTPSVQQAMNAGNSTWSACADAPYAALSSDIEQSVADLLPDLLTAYQVLNYNGNMDLICNYIGTVEWTSNIEWPGQEAYNSATNQTWSVAGKPAGYYKYASNLAHLVVYNAGHMAPFSQPQNTQNMLYTFIAGGFQNKK